jgi:hypothetical protein
LRREVASLFVKPEFGRRNVGPLVADASRLDEGDAATGMGHVLGDRLTGCARAQHDDVESC